MKMILVWLGAASPGTVCGQAIGHFPASTMALPKGP